MKPPVMRLPAEALAGAVGPQRLLALKPRPISAADGSRALRVPKEVIALIRGVIDREPKGTAIDKPEPLDYFETLELVSQPSDVLADRLPDLLADIVDQDLAHETGDVLMLGCEFLRTALPRASEETLLGTKPLEPSRVEWAKFRRQWAVANDPLEALRSLAAGYLVDDEVDVLKQLYPQLYDAGIRATVVAELAARAAREEGWEPLHEQRRQLETLLQLSPVDPDFARQLQEVSQAAQKEHDIRTAPLQIDVKGMELPSQRLQAR